MTPPNFLNLYEGIRTDYGERLVLFIEQHSPDILVAVVDRTRSNDSEYVWYGHTGCTDLDEVKRNTIEYANHYLNISIDLPTEWVPYKAELARLGVVRI
jgi:hypothetical protein